jgi:amidohydrolase
MPIKNRLAELTPEIAAWRRDIHTHPELAFEEHRTAALVAEKLRGFGCDEVHEGVGVTGVVGVIRGRQSGSGRVIGFRADMDALPIHEATGAAHASTHIGKMHACGHDGHTAMLLGAAQYLAETRNYDGTVVVIFQPAEEAGGGARAMVEAGVMDRFGVEEIYGMHNFPGLPVGSFAVRPGPILAAVGMFEITVKGRGGHGAMPHLAVDTNLAAAAIVMALQSIVARNADPLKTAVVSVGGMRSETHAFNVIPDTVTLLGTTRYLDPSDRGFIEARLAVIAQSTAAAYGAEAEVVHTQAVLPTVNAEAQAEHAARAAETVAGTVRRDLSPSMGGEDFSEMLAARPGAFMIIGNGATADLHNPRYDFNDEAIPAGCSWFATLAEERMPVT